MATNPVNTTNQAPAQGVKYATKQVWRDPESRKAFVFYVDANTGGVLLDLTGYKLWEAGVITDPPGTTTPTPTASSGRGGGDNGAQYDPRNEDRYLGRGEERGGLFGSVQNSGFGNRFDKNTEAPVSGNIQSVTSETYPGGQGKITVSPGKGPATEGTYNVNTPSMNARTSPDVMSKDLGMKGYANQSFSDAKLSFSFPSDQPQASVGQTSAPSPNLEAHFAQYGASTTPTVEQVHDAFTAMGYSSVDATAMVANFALENGIATRGGVFDLGAKAWGTEKSYGLAQWNAAAGRFGQLQAFAKELGKPWNSLEVQTRFVDYEMKNTHQKAFKEMTAAKTVQEKTMAVAKYYEIPAAYIDAVAKGVPYEKTKEAQARLSWTDKLVAQGFVERSVGMTSSVASTSPVDARQDITGLGTGSISAPSTDGRLPGSGAPAIQKDSMWEQLGGTLPDVSYGATTSGVYDSWGNSPKTIDYVPEAAGVNAGPYAGPQGNVNNPGATGFVSGPPDLSNSRTMGGPIAMDKGMSQIGRNPTTGDEFAVAREAERQTAANFAEAPISERTLSGEVSKQGPTPSVDANGFITSSEIDYGNVAGGKGSLVASSGGLQYDASRNRATTVGATDIVMSNVMPNGSGLHLTANENIQYEIDTKTGKMAAVAQARDPKTQMTVSAINQTLGLQGKLLDGVKYNPAGILTNIVGSLVTQGAKVVDRAKTEQLMQEFGPKSQIAMNDYETSVVTAQPGPEPYTNTTLDRTAYDKMSQSITRQDTGFGISAPVSDPNNRVGMTLDSSAPSSNVSNTDTESFFDSTPNYDFAQQGPNLSGISRGTQPTSGSGFSFGNTPVGGGMPASNYTPFSGPTGVPSYDAPLGRSSALTPDAPQKSDYDSFKDRMAAIGAYNPETQTMNFDRVPNNEARYRDDAFSTPAFGPVGTYQSMDSAKREATNQGFVNQGSRFNPDMYMSKTVGETLNPSAYSFGNTPVGGGMPGKEKGWGEIVSEAAKGFAEGIGTAMTGAISGGFGMGGRQDGPQTGWGDGNFSFGGGIGDRGDNSGRGFGGYSSNGGGGGGDRGDNSDRGFGGGSGGGGGDRGGDRGGGGPSGGYDYGNGYSDAKDGGLGSSNGGGNQGGYTGGGPTSGPSGGGGGYTGGGPTSGPSSGGGGYTGGGPTSGPSSDGKASGPSGGGYGGWGGPR